MLDCEAASRLTIPAFRIAVARKLVHDYGLSQGRVAALIGIKQASVSNYLSLRQSPRTEALASYITSKGLEGRLVKMALAGAQKPAIFKALERAASDPSLARVALSTKGLQLMKKSISERV